MTSGELIDYLFLYHPSGRGLMVKAFESSSLGLGVPLGELLI